MMTDNEFEILWQGGEVEAQQDVRELKPFFRIVESLEPKNVIEIGVEKGGTFRFWIQAVKSNGRVIGVDMQDALSENVAHHYDIGSFGNKKVVLISGSSQDRSTIDKVSDGLSGEQADMLFIDACHDYDKVKSDYENYSQFVRSGGIIGFHDIHMPGPKRLYWEIVSNLNNPQQFCDPEQIQRGACGIGMGYKK